MYLHKVIEYLINQSIYMLKILSRKCFVTDSTLIIKVYLIFEAFGKLFTIIIYLLSCFAPRTCPVAASLDGCRSRGVMCSDHVLWSRNKPDHRPARQGVRVPLPGFGFSYYQLTQDGPE